jgi:hypothetical protein
MKRIKRTLILFSAFCFLAVNVLAYMQAYHFIHYSSGGKRTEKPETIGFTQKLKVLLTGANIPRPEISITPAFFGLKFKTLTYSTEDGQKLSAWYVPRAHPKAMALFFEGHDASKSQLLPEAKAFYDQGYELFLADFRGCGESPGSQSSFGYFEARDVKAATLYVQGHWPGEKTVLYGSSMGSAAILHAYAQGPLPADCVILGCPFDSFFHTVQNRFSILGVPPFPLIHFLMFWGSLQLGFNGYSYKPMEDAKSVHCPALLLYGAKDRNVLPSESESVFKCLGGVKSAKEFMNCGHESFFGRDPDPWKKAVFGFLKENLQSGVNP